MKGLKAYGIIPFMPDLQDNIKIITALAIQEDLGTGDITSDLTIDPKQKSKGKIIAKEDGVVSGLAVVEYILNNYTSLTYKFKKHDGDKVVDKEVVVHLSGSTIEILSYERTMLNFLQHLSGIATATSKFVEKAEPFGCKILDTRKTLPGLRKLEKKAVVDGGGMNHRMGLHDAVLIKENHIRAAGSISSAIKKICVSPRFIDLKKKKGFFILVETETLKEVEEACQSTSFNVSVSTRMKNPFFFFKSIKR
ncbi:MAG: nicotinate-nucleotide diphosphorylase (carboxylating), partial [Candidatus Margulisbacteria bacterium GWF2_35_9]